MGSIIFGMSVLVLGLVAVNLNPLMGMRLVSFGLVIVGLGLIRTARLAAHKS